MPGPVVPRTQFFTSYSPQILSRYLAYLGTVFGSRMSLSTWPGANVTSFPGFQLAGTALAAGASLVQPASIPGYRFLRPLKTKLIAGAAIVAVLGVILLSPSSDTNVSTLDAALEDSVSRMNQDSLNRAVWHIGDNGYGADYGYPADDLACNTTVGDSDLFEFSRHQLATRLGLDTLYSIIHKSISEPLKHLDERFHEASGIADDAKVYSRSYLEDLDTLYHNLDGSGVFDWSTYEILSLFLFIRLYLGVLKRLYAFSFGRRAPATPQSEVSLISNFVFAESTARIERYVPELGATLQLFATISFERDGSPHSTGYIFDMSNDGSHTGRLFVQQPALPDAANPAAFRSFVQFLCRSFHAVVSFVAMIQNLAVSPFAWFHSKLKAKRKTQPEAPQRILEQSFVEEGNTFNDDPSPARLGFSENELMGLDVTGVVTVNESSYHGCSDSEWPPSPDSRGSYHSILSNLAHNDTIPNEEDLMSSQPASEDAKGKAKGIAQVDCTNPQNDSEDGGSSTEILLRGATQAVDELLCSANGDNDKANHELYKSMRIVKDLLAALSGQIAALDIPEDDYSRYLSDVEGQSDFELSEDDKSCFDLTLITDTQSGFTYECTSHSDDDSLTLKFAVRDSNKEPSSSVPSGELSLIRKKDGPQASGSCTTVIATGPIFSPPYVQPSDPSAPIFVVIPGFRRQRKRPKNRARGKGRSKHTKEAEAEAETDTE